MSERAKHLARIGQAHLEEAVLEALFHLYERNSFGHQLSIIAHIAGIYTGTSMHEENSNHITAGIIGRLRDANRVREVGRSTGARKRMHWRLTDDEYQARKVWSQ